MTTSRKICRSGQPCTPTSIKEALDCLAHHGELSVEELAERIGHIAPGTLGKQCSRYDEDNYPTLRNVIPLTLLSKSDVLIDYLARAVGGVFVRVRAWFGPSDCQSVAKMVNEFGELLSAVAQSTADGCVTAEELERVEREWQDVVTAGAALMEQLRAVAVQPAQRRSA